MASAKIIAIIDHENRALRSDVNQTIHDAVSAATQPLVEKLIHIETRVKQLESDLATLKAFAQHYVTLDMKNQARKSVEHQA